MILDKIKGLCNKFNISIAELERNLEFGNGSIRKWSSASPSISKLMKVSKYFGVNIQYFIDDEYLSYEAFVFAKEYDKLSKKQKKLIECYMSVV